MTPPSPHFERTPHRERAIVLGQWLVLGAVVGMMCGAASALFLWLLDVATDLRVRNERIVYALPAAGFIIGWLYDRMGQPVKGGNNLILETLHGAEKELPLRMAPMVLIGTVLTHLFGGSAGREGTAVQMGGGLTDWLSHRLRLNPTLRRQLLSAGVAGGFGSVFGTPISGAVFGLEFATPGRIEYRALLPALVASVVGDLTTRTLGIAHTPYPAVDALALSPLVLAKWAAFAVGAAFTTIVFIELTQVIKRQSERRLRGLGLRMLVGGLAIVGLWKLVGTSDYLGLGVPMIVRAFEEPSLPWFVFALKILFTAITIGTGFLGGEVTPLFFIGATLGSTLAHVLHLPLAMSAGVGLAAVFAAASNTPLALSIMAVELLGSAVLPHVVIVCVATYLLTGQRGIYPAQRLVHTKLGQTLKQPTRLSDFGTAAHAPASSTEPPPRRSQAHAPGSSH